MTLKIKYITNAVHAVLVLTVLASVFVVLSASASASASIQIDDASAESGSTATTPITINGMTNFGAATVTLSYDPSVVQITDVTAGDVGDPTENINNTAGTATMAAYVSTVTGPDSPITFANIELLAVGNDGESSPLTLEVTTLAGADGTPVPATTESGVFVVGTGTQFLINITAGTAADIVVSGTFDNNVTGSISLTPVADPEETVGSYAFIGDDVALLGIIVTPDAAVLAELANGNGTIRIEVCYNATELAGKNIESSTLALWRFDGTDWVKMVAGTDPCVANGRDGTCIWIEVNNLSTFALVGTTASSPSGGGGDLNGDGSLTPSDAAIALEIAVGIRPFDDAADVNGDGEVTSLDALMILQAAAGAIEL